MIVSFYSYKGGVGRTQLLANLAAYLCFYEGKKILLIDWDFEAPGLHYYFDKKYEDIKTDGLIELLWEFVYKMENKSINSENIPKFQKNIHIQRFKSATKKEGVIDYIPAGNYSNKYNEKVNDFNWNTFYEQLDGKLYIEYLKKCIKEMEYDFIFLDSRTGISDYSGICNIQMPDVNVLITYPNHQNFENIVKVARNIKNSAYITNGFRKPILIPLLSKLDLSQNKEAIFWQNRFLESFGNDIENLKQYSSTPIDTTNYINNTLLDYKKDLSFEERLLFSDEPNVNLKFISLERSYATIATLLMGLIPE